jgi:hypothetical protein
VKENLDFARNSAIIPIRTVDYVKAAQGFYTAEIEKLGAMSWRIKNRQNLQTVRFDRAFQLVADMENSVGVLGYNYYQGSLYVSLDPAVMEPIVALGDLKTLGRYGSQSKPYLLESNWLIKDLQFINKSLIFDASGFGQSIIKFRMSDAKEKNKGYHVEVAKDKKVVYSAQVEIQGDGILELNIPPQTGQNVHVVLTEM